MFLAFPNFNLYSTPLLVLVSQGLLLGSLLLVRYYKKVQISDLFLGLLVLITCYHRTTYTIGFMGWYDTYNNTKINYWLISLFLAIGPLIYFYVKSVTTSDFKFKRRDLYHFVPVLVYVVYRSVIFIYDAAQPGFDNQQNGVLMMRFENGVVAPFTETFGIIQQLLYLTFSLQLYYKYKGAIQNYFSNTYALELNWIRNFLLIYSFLFLYGVLQQLVNEYVIELSWIQKWWKDFFSALAVIYVGIKGYFTDTTKLNGLDFKLKDKLKYFPNSVQTVSTERLENKAAEIDAYKKELLIYMKEHRPYLNPDLNLQEMAQAINLSRAQLSEVINYGFNKNFNDFINEYRVNAVKEMFSKGRQEQLSLLGIAYECGFNSKATFNRAFKKLTHSSPSEFLKAGN
ncbi:helix-turn-helix domain-containing protein [Muriicola sp. Z0-33]|uniref:helix-turn-helix domain-containing protein n=1 Tax=Muriicola sp. Z0-33 TaxID=2816957 RepID=UPI002237B360|nr:AraC family transcriptional regulator [Muriicola sp. Z0-33]